MRLLYITYRVDPRDSLVGYVLGWIDGLAACMEQIEVVCLAASQAGLPENVRVHSLGKERGVGRVGRWRNFYQTVWGLRHAVDAVFCQFSPEYVIAVAPLARLHGWPITLWYTHRHVSLRLRLATALAHRVVAASPESFRLRTAKLRIIGHGIDTERFQPSDSAGSTAPIVLAVGRRSPIKHYELLIDATAILAQMNDYADIRVRIVGGDEGHAPAGYAAQLQERINRAGISDAVELVGPLPFDRLAAEYRRAAVHINLCPTGGMDKAALESMAAGIPTLLRNETFRPLLGAAASELLLADHSAEAVAHGIRQLLSKSPLERAALGARLRQAVLQHHSQDALIGKLATVLKES